MFNTSRFNKENGYNIVSASDPLSVVAEQYRKLRTNIEYSTFGKEMKVINFTSTFKAEGKTVTALNLATVYAQSGTKTLLIDMDLRRPKIHRAFELVNENGLTDLVSAGKDIREGIRQVDETMYLLPAGSKIPFSSEFLMSAQVKNAIKTLRNDFDRIIIDCPPYLGYLTDNGLYAAQDVLIPALAETTSKRALELLFDHIESLELDYEISFAERGVVANRVEETNEATEMMEWFWDAFPDVPVWEIRKRVALQRAFSAGCSIFEYKPDCDMADRYLEIAASLDEQYGLQEPEVVR